MPSEPDALDRQRCYERSIDRRLTILETRFDTILPTLVTKADLAALKAELTADIGAEFASLSSWMACISVGIFIGFGTMILTMLLLFKR